MDLSTIGRGDVVVGIDDTDDYRGSSVRRCEVMNGSMIRGEGSSREGGSEARPQRG